MQKAFGKGKLIPTSGELIINNWHILKVIKIYLSKVADDLVEVFTVVLHCRYVHWQN
jgi:hypothetical protein